jgi:threonyl-tRNA synthetase
VIELQFPDGAVRSFEPGVTGRAVAASIAPSLGKRAVLVKLNGSSRAKS